MAKRFMRLIFRVLLKLLSRIHVEGKEIVPEHGGVILATNHLGTLDPVLIFVVLDRIDVTAMVAKKHLKNPFFRVIVNIAGGIWLNREEADSQAFRAATKHLENGGILGLAPEGTRSSTGALLPAKTGPAYLAVKTGVPVIPVAITGSYQGIKRILRLNRIPMTIRFGKPMTLAPVDRHNRDEALRKYTDEIMCQIAAMLPESYRGVYADHPRLKEILIQADEPAI